MINKYHSLLVLRFWIFNITCVGAGVGLWLGGLLQPLLNDSTYITHGIVALFVYGLALSSWRAYQFAGMIDKGPNCCTPAESVKLWLVHRVNVVKALRSQLVLWGLIGTVVGFMIALRGITADNVADVSSIGPMVAQLQAGMATALNTTVVGSVLSAWLTANIVMLEGAATHLMRKYAGV